VRPKSAVPVAGAGKLKAELTALVVLTSGVWEKVENGAKLFDESAEPDWTENDPRGFSIENENPLCDPALEPPKSNLDSSLPDDPVKLDKALAVDGGILRAKLGTLKEACWVDNLGDCDLGEIALGDPRIVLPPPSAPTGLDGYNAPRALAPDAVDDVERNPEPLPFEKENEMSGAAL